MRLCGLVPTYDNPDTVGGVVENMRRYLDDVIVIDDASGSAGRAACVAIAQTGMAYVEHRQHNGGKGAAVKTGFSVAARLGFSHALQVDADGQHDTTKIPEFIDAAKREPAAFVVGYPVYDASVPTARLWARKLTKFWVDLEIGRERIQDAMVGFRVYPLDIAQAVGTRGNRMDFDVEIAVRLAWTGMPIVNMAVPVRYLDADAGGISHFQPLRDNVRLSWMHSRLCTAAIFRRTWRALGGRPLDAHVWERR